MMKSMQKQINFYFIETNKFKKLNEKKYFKLKHCCFSRKFEI